MEKPSRSPSGPRTTMNCNVENPKFPRFVIVAWQTFFSDTAKMRRKNIDAAM